MPSLISYLPQANSSSPLLLASFNKSNKSRIATAVLIFVCLYIALDIAELLETPSIFSFDEQEHNSFDFNRRLQHSGNISKGISQPGFSGSATFSRADSAEELSTPSLPSNPAFSLHNPRSTSRDEIGNNFILAPPSGFPWHRWGDWKSSSEIAVLNSNPLTDASSSPEAFANQTMDGQTSSSEYPLNTTKFLSVLSLHGQKKEVSTLMYNLLIKHERGVFDAPFLTGNIKVFVFRNGTILAEDGATDYWDKYAMSAKGYQIDFLKIAQRALNMAKSLEEVDPRMKLITEGDFPIIFDHFDYPWCGDDLVPVFRTNLFKSNCRYAWPGLSLIYLTKSYDKQLRSNAKEWANTFAENERQYPWEDKIDKVVWRGKMTGYHKIYKNAVTPRMRLFWKSKYHDNFMDVKFIPFHADPKRNFGRIPSSNMRYKMNQQDYMKYRAILDIDGNAWSSRFANLLCMNSVVLKVEPRFVNYFEKELVSWKHYIPVRDDLKDLRGKMNYVSAKANEAKIRQIVKNANDYCSWKFTHNQQTEDFLWTLLSYAELLRDAPNFYKAWKNNYYAYNLPALNMAPLT